MGSADRNSPSLDGFRTIFGDERQDYGSALQQHYAGGAPADWPDHFVTAYASSHPWEDFAETWAHYFHIVDTLETASAFGLSVSPRLPKSGGDLRRTSISIRTLPSMDRLVEAWLPLTFAMNSINRSMGLQDLYPFVLAPAVIVKTRLRQLAFILRRRRRGAKPPRQRAEGHRRRAQAQVCPIPASSDLDDR